MICILKCKTQTFTNGCRRNVQYVPSRTEFVLFFLYSIFAEIYSSTGVWREEERAPELSLPDCDNNNIVLSCHYTVAETGSKLILNQV